MANRIDFIRQNSLNSFRRCVPSSKNPADVSSRGIDARHEDLLNKWMNGQTYLKSDSQGWSIVKDAFTTEPPSDAEVRRDAIVANEMTITTQTGALLLHHTSWLKLKRAVANLLRIRNYLTKSVDMRDTVVVSGILCVHELRGINSEIRSTPEPGSETVNVKRGDA